MPTETMELPPLRLLSVIIPVYNEKIFLPQLLEKIGVLEWPMEVILVDDGSTDGTQVWLKKFQSDHSIVPQSSRASIAFKFIYHPTNQGKGAAIRAGLKEATGNLLIIQDADLEYDPSEYGRLMEPILLGQADVVYGSRFLGESRRVLSFSNIMSNKIITFISNIFTDLGLTDMVTGYKMFKTDIMKSINLRSNRFGIEPEITAKISKLRCAIYEVPISFNGRTATEGKKSTWFDGILVLFTIIKYWLIDDLFENTAVWRALRIMEGASAYNSWLAKKVLPDVGTRVLETGSGTGNITTFLLESESVVATDLEEFYLDDLKRKFRMFTNVHVRKLDLLLDNETRAVAEQLKPNTVLSMNVLEHIEDHGKALRNIRDLLPSGGRLVILVPAHQLLYGSIDKQVGHFRRYSKESLSKIIEESGLTVKKSTYLNMLGAIGWFINGRVLKKKLFPSRQVRLFDFLVKILKIEDYIDPPFGLSVVVVAEKP